MLAFIVLIGAAVRCAWPERMAVEHFDEGVYASNLWFTAEDRYAYPLRHLYAPPLVPAAAEWSLILSRFSPAAPVWFGVLAGVLIVPSIWWIGRAWFGPAAGLSAAALAAASDVHGLFSRTILTDPWLLLWLAWATFFMERALRTARAGDIAAAGALTGLACWTKYNGWLPLAWGLGAVALSAVIHRPGKRVVGRMFLTWGAVAGIAFVVWAPVLWSLQEHGGYAAVAANHQRYTVGLEGWWDALGRQEANLATMESWLSIVIAPLTAAAVASLTGAEGRRRSAMIGLAIVAPAIAIFAGFGSAAALGLLTAAALLAHFGRIGRSVGGASAEAPSQSAIMLAMWFLFLSATTPLYTPYARLTLPWLAATWLGGGWAIGETAAWLRRSAENQTRRRPASVLIAATLLGLGAAAVRGGSWTARPVATSQDRATLAAAVSTLLDAAEQTATIPSGPGAANSIRVFYVYGEPAVFYHLRAAGQPDVLTTSHLDLPLPPDASIPMFLITGPHSAADPAFARQWAELEALWPLVAEAPFSPSAVMRLDHLDPRSPEKDGQFRLRMYRAR